MAADQAVVMKCTIFWDITQCSPLKVSDVSEEHVACIFRVEAELCFHTGLLLGLFFDPEDGGDMFL
jgi:hypothetical protein